MIDRPAKVKPNDVSTTDLVRFDGGLFLNGASNAPKNAFVDAKDIQIDRNGYIEPRDKLTKVFPDTVSTSYQKMPILWNGSIYYFTADDGKIKYHLAGANSWTDCTGTNSFTTNNGGMPKFLRALDKVLILNGKNGDKLAYVDLATAGFPVVKYTLVTDPASAPTAALTNLTTGSYKVYYAISYSGTVGETLLSPILTQTVNHVREEWTTMASPGSVEITRVGAAPTGAQYWNVYMALAASGGVITADDMLLVASQLDLSVTKFTDNGSLAVQLGSAAPLANSTDGPKVEQGIVVDGTPILYADQDSPYNIWIGGPGPNALDFTISNGGYRAEPEKGTNYYPTTVIGFRTGQGLPALTVLYSNTEGLSKQAVLQQQTVTYGDSSFTVWGITEQHYGAAGVAAPNSAINYNGRLLFLSTDGFMSMETQPSVQNVLSTRQVSVPIDEYVRSIKTSAMQQVVGTGWNNKYMWLIPSYGFDTPQEILILDTNNKGVDGNGAWYTFKIAAQWIGVISPPDSPAYIYVCQGNKTYKLIDLDSTFDLVSGSTQGFSTLVSGPLLAVSGEAHNTWQASVQVMFNLLDISGDVTIGVTYRNQAKKLKTKTKKIVGPVATPSIAGGWGDPHWTYANFGQIAGWRTIPPIDATAANREKVDKRVPVRVDDVINEAQWFLSTEIGYNNYKLKSVSFEGINLGVRPDLQ